MGWIDIHCHILPGLDDGSKNMEQTERMLRIAYSEGIRTMITTPHNYASHRSASPETIRKTVAQVNAFAKEKNIGITLYPGNEIFYRQGVGELIEQGKILTMADSNYVLVEFYPNCDYQYLRAGIQELQQYGYEVILAHAERYDCLYEKKGRLQDLHASGVLIQVNASSFLASFGAAWRKRSRSLLKQDLIRFLGTDAHNEDSRSPKLDAAAKFLFKKVGAKQAEALLYQNAKKEILTKGN